MVLIPLFLVVDLRQYWQLIALFWTILNVVVRTQWPSQYNPALACSKSIVSSPYTARVIATFAEFYMYYTMAQWVNTQFFGTALGTIVIIGEIVCWSALLNQSEFLNWIEDSIWALHAIYMAYLSETTTQLIIFSVFASYLILYHLPRMGMRITRPLIKRRGEIDAVRIGLPDADSRSWIVPMLVLFPLI